MRSAMPCFFSDQEHIKIGVWLQASQASVWQMLRAWGPIKSAFILARPAFEHQSRAGHRGG
jgi:hypothetical protein